MFVRDDVNTPEEGEPSDENKPDNQQISEDETVEMVEEEIEALNNHLDRLGSALNNLEEKNDNIHAQLLELLEANRQAKMIFQAATPQNENEGSNQHSNS